MSTHWSRQPHARLSSFYFLYYAALGAFTPYWSLYLQARGMGTEAISVLMSLWYATRIVAPTTWTSLAARSLHPIRWLRWGCLLTVLAFLAFLFPLRFAGLFTAMCVFCFAYNAVMPQFEAITLSHLGRRSDRYGAIRVWGSIGFILVVALFGGLLEVVGAAQLPWLMLPLFLLLLGSAFANDYARGGEHDEEHPEGFRQRLMRPEVLAFFFAAFLAQVSFGPYYTFFSIYLESHGYRGLQLGLFWSVGVVAEIVVFFLSQRLFRYMDAGKVFCLALLSAALRWWMTAAWPDSPWLLSIAQLTHALNFGAFFAAAMQLLVRYFPGRMNGHGQGIFYGVSSGIGGVAGALLAGQLWQASGNLAFGVAGGISLLAAIIGWYWLVHRLPAPT